MFNLLFSNPILNADSYKIGMPQMYKPGITEVYSFIESRGGEYDEIVVSGISSFIDEYLTEPLSVENVDKISEFLALRDEPFDRARYDQIVSLHGGKYPLEIMALAEGTVVPVGVPVAVVRNTSPEAYWLTTTIETAFLRTVWSSTTVATKAREIRKVIKVFYDETCDSGESFEWQLHNFGDRGAHGSDIAARAGAAHLLSFSGTDSLIGTYYVKEKFEEHQVFGYSVPASEHSISTSWGDDFSSEKSYVIHMIDTFSPKYGIISIVSDTYNIFEFVKMVCTDNDIVARVKALGSEGKKIVLRPDSGNPVTLIPWILEQIQNAYGVKINSKGYKTLPPGIGLIWGDGINIHTIKSILETLKKAGWAASCVVFGMGGALTGLMGRDDQKFAMKASNIIIDGTGKGIAKKPVTDTTKTSKYGKFAVFEGHDGKLTWSNDFNRPGNLLKQVYLNGEFNGFGKFVDARFRARKGVE